MKATPLAPSMLLIAINLSSASAFLALQGRSLPWKRLGSPATRLASSITIAEEAKIIQDMLYRIRAVNNMPQSVIESAIDFQVDGVKLGRLMPSMMERLVRTPFFEMQGDSLTLSESAGKTCDSRTKAVQSVMMSLRDQGVVRGWRDELYPISDGFYSDPVFLMERASVPVLGGLEYGVHVNGLTEKEGRKFMWIARRSKSKSKYPGLLDHMVAGGQPFGISLSDNVVKECLEEAGISETLTRQGIKATGVISYENYEETKHCISRAVLFCYDLMLPQSFTPTPVDGEVEEFFLWEIDDIKASFDPEYPDPIKPNCYPVIIDFLLREGYIGGDTPGYLDILRELRSGECK
jgi:8-oxo-dGTP pyrophosphatase MutT (NUDIX family)